jgi:hypothetical protein
MDRLCYSLRFAKQPCTHSALLYSVPWNLMDTRSVVPGDTCSWHVIWERVGNALWFPQFSVDTCPFRHTLFLLLWEMFRNHVCCFITGSLIYFSDGVYRNYKGVTMYICMTDTTVSRLIFQMADDIIPAFPVGDFTFRYLRSFIDDNEDIYIYEVTRGTDFRVQFFIIGVDVSAPTGVLCNVDSIRFFEPFRIHISQTLCTYAHSIPLYRGQTHITRTKILQGN